MMSRHIVRIVILLLFGFGISQSVQAQYCTNWFTNPFCYFCLFHTHDGDSKARVIPDLTEVGDSLLQRTTEPYVRYRYMEPDCNLSDLDLIFVRNKHGRIKRAFLLLEKDDYMIACAQPKSLCDCDSNILIYVPSTNSLKAIERPFSFSLRKDLEDALRERTGVLMNRKDYADLCDMLTALAEN